MKRMTADEIIDKMMEEEWPGVKFPASGYTMQEFYDAARMRVVQITVNKRDRMIYLVNLDKLKELKEGRTWDG